jgi:large subunit ribosomal protein L7/L12
MSEENVESKEVPAEIKEVPAEIKEVPAEIKELGDKLSALTLKQAVELGEYLKDEYGIEAAAGAVMVGGPAVAAEEEVEEQTSFDVVLKDFGDKKIQVIKVVRALTNLGLKEAKELVESAPKPVKQGVPKEEAADAVKQIVEAGGTAEVV